MQCRIEMKEEPGPEDREAILGPLSDFNARHGYPADSKPVALLLKDERDRTVGGLWGRTGYGWLYVEFLSAVWHDDAARLRRLLLLALDDATTADAVLGRLLGIEAAHMRADRPFLALVRAMDLAALEA